MSAPRSDLDRFTSAFSYVVDQIKRFKKTLSARELLILQVGMRACHAEEAAALGDAERAKAHVNELAKLIAQL